MTPLGRLSAQSSAPSPRLLAQVDEHASTPPSATARFEFGSRSVLDTSPITHTFVLRSPSDKPLTVDRLQPSCRCTTAIVEGIEDEAPPFTLAPGHEARVRVLISPADAVAGPFEKEVYVFAQGDSIPTATLQMSGELTAPVTFEPAMLDFGRVTEKNAAPLSVTVTVDNRLLLPERRIHLRCDNSDVQLTRISSQKKSATEGSTQETYRIALSPHAHTGPLRAALSVGPGSDAWSTALVTGEVIGGR